MPTPNDIALENLPPVTATWSELESFCGLIGGPNGDPRDIDQLHAIAHQAESNLRAATVDDLLAAAYFHWRKVRWNSESPEDIIAIRAAVEELRHRLRG